MVSVDERHVRIGAPVACLVVGAALLLAGCGPAQPSAPFEVRVTYRAMPAEGMTPSAADLEAIRSIVESRLQDTGVAILRVDVKEPDLVIVETAPASVADELRPLAGATGRVDFVPLGDTQVAEGQPIDLERFPPLFTGDQIASATIAADQAGMRAVNLVLKDEGRQLFADYTSGNVGSSFAIVLDGQAISVPVIREPIPGGEVQISAGGLAGFELSSAQRIVTLLRHGPLPFPLQEVALERL